jgi:hypothetical protein
VESIAIVASILLAFAIDAWWADRQDRAEEMEILRAIDQDVIATQQAVRTSHDRQTFVLANLRALLDGSAARASEGEESILSEHLYTLWITPSISVQMSAYDEIRNSGRLGLIENPVLRRVLAEFDRRLADARGIYEDNFQHQQLKIDPYMLANIQMSVFSEAALRDVEGAIPFVSPTASQDHRFLLDDAMFQNQVVAKYYLLAEYSESTLELLETLEEIRKELKVYVRDTR